MCCSGATANCEESWTPLGSVALFFCAVLGVQCADIGYIIMCQRKELE